MKLVLAGEHKKIKADCKEDPMLVSNKGEALELTNMLYIRNVSRNIISMRRLMDGGCTMQGMSKLITFKKKGFSLKETQEKISGFYILKAKC